MVKLGIRGYWVVGFVVALTIASLEISGRTSVFVDNESRQRRGLFTMLVLAIFGLWPMWLMSYLTRLDLDK